MSEKKPRLYGPREAAEYLRQKWGLPRFSVDAFRQHRYRHRDEIKSLLPELADSSVWENSSAWTKEELDAIPEPNKAKRRQKQPQDKGDKDKEGKEDLDKNRVAVLSFA